MDRINRREFLNKLSLLGLGVLCGYGIIGCDDIDKGSNMETYEIYTPNGWLLDVDKKQIKYTLQMMA